MIHDTKHTPLPWLARMSPRQPDKWGVCTAGDDEPEALALLHEYSNVYGQRLPTQANAEFIALACNCHYDLLAALEAMLHTELVTKPNNLDEFEIRADVLEQAREAIRKARGREIKE